MAWQEGLPSEPESVIDLIISYIPGYEPPPYRTVTRDIPGVTFQVGPPSLLLIAHLS